MTRYRYYLICIFFLMLAQVGCGTWLTEAPIPEGQDWYFLEASCRQTMATVSTKTSTVGNVKTTTTTSSMVQWYEGVAAPTRPPAKVVLFGQDDHAQLKTKPFRPLGEMP